MTGYEIEKEHALKIIKAMRTNWDEDSKTPNALALDMAIESLEKQIPRELKKQGFFKVCKCGCEMSTFLMHNRANYCPNCGQAIKWD